MCFHGIFDFAYLLRCLTADTLPVEESSFQELMDQYFGTYYDVKVLSDTWEHLRGGLAKLGQTLNVTTPIHLRSSCVPEHNIKQGATVSSQQPRISPSCATTTRETTGSVKGAGTCFTDSSPEEQGDRRRKWKVMRRWNMPGRTGMESTLMLYKDLFGICELPLNRNA